MLHRTTHIATVLVLCCATTVMADEPPQSTRDWLNHFSRNWSETSWQQKGRNFPAGYMRAADDAGWQYRMRALQGCVRQGNDAIPILLDALQTGDAPQRILAAQTLGYLGTKVPAEPLLAALKAEADPAVRLYLVDTLGMLGKGEAVNWEEYVKTESNRDVQRHVAYVQERGDKPLDPRVTEALGQWDAEKINTAAVGKPAPDFALASAQGDTVRLGDFRGKQAVVLVFIYGDT